MGKYVDENGYVWLSGEEQIDSLFARLESDSDCHCGFVQAADDVLGPRPVVLGAILLGAAAVLGVAAFAGWRVLRR